ncbi:hypothetical protein BDF19DRAFT_435137 [Syncephalis fuscata]|nr:hypothetical protein BDF19DRAFT_435137 [Syncephalis fuscata]
MSHNTNIENAKIMLAKRQYFSAQASSKVSILTIIPPNRSSVKQINNVDVNCLDLARLDLANNMSPVSIGESTSISDTFDFSDIEQVETPSFSELSQNDQAVTFGPANEDSEDDLSETEEVYKMRSSRNRPGTPVPLKLALSMDILLHSPLWDKPHTLQSETLPQYKSTAKLRRVSSMPSINSPTRSNVKTFLEPQDDLQTNATHQRRGSHDLNSSGSTISININNLSENSTDLFTSTTQTANDLLQNQQQNQDQSQTLTLEPVAITINSPSPSLPIRLQPNINKHPTLIKPLQPTLDDILKDKTLYRGFEIFLAEHFAEENLIFLRDVRLLRMQVNNPAINIEYLQQELERLLNEYIHTGAPMEVNITSKCRRRIFDAAQVVTIHGRGLHKILIEAELEIEFLLQERVDAFFRELDHAILNQKIQGRLSTNQRHVVIVGGGFAGFSCAEILDRMPRFHVTLIDPKTYIEYTPGVIPYSRNLEQLSRIQLLHRTYVRNGVVIRDTVNSVHANYVCAGRKQIPFHYLLIATGSSYQNGLKPTQPTRSHRTKFIEIQKHQVKKANSILIIGAGPVGCQTACEIASNFPDKKITLVGSSIRVLSHWSSTVSAAMKARLEALNVDIHLNERLNPMPEQNGNISIKMKHNNYLPESWLDDRQHVMIKPTLQIQHKDNIFAAGDIVDLVKEKTAFAAMCAGLCVARNICRMEKNAQPFTLGSSDTILPDTYRQETHLYAGGILGFAVTGGNKSVLNPQARGTKESLERAFLAHIQGSFIPTSRYGRRPRVLELVNMDDKRKPATNSGKSMSSSLNSPKQHLSVASISRNKSEEHLSTKTPSPLRSKSSSPAAIRIKQPQMSFAIPYNSNLQSLQFAVDIQAPTPLRERFGPDKNQILQGIGGSENYDTQLNLKQSDNQSTHLSIKSDATRATSPISLSHASSFSSASSSPISSPISFNSASNTPTISPATSPLHTSELHKSRKGILKAALFSKITSSRSRTEQDEKQSMIKSSASFSNLEDAKGIKSSRSGQIQQSLKASQSTDFAHVSRSANNSPVSKKKATNDNLKDKREYEMYSGYGTIGSPYI